MPRIAPVPTQTVHQKKRTKSSVWATAYEGYTCMNAKRMPTALGILELSEFDWGSAVRVICKNSLPSNGKEY
jgi:hypothetical protein